MKTWRLSFLGALALAIATIALVGLNPRDVQRVQACGVGGPYDFDTFETSDPVHVYDTLINLAAYGRAVSAPFAVEPPAPRVAAAPDADAIFSGAPPPAPILTGNEGAELAADFTYQGLERGPRSARTTPDRSAVIPPSILKSIVFIESTWANGSEAVPWGAVGPILRSFDCGYGLGQITSGMYSDASGTPSLKQALIGTHPAFNLAEGARILAGKWNDAPGLRPIAGTGDPNALEDWYFAVWSYNGFAETNHPLNPYRDPLRGEMYHCFNDSAPNRYSGFGYGDYTYPERMYGCMEHPPTRAVNGVPVQLWQPVNVNMPLMSDPKVAAAFKLDVYRACADTLNAEACAKMDFPTSFPAVTDKEHPEKNRPQILVHYDPTVVDWTAASPLPSGPGAYLEMSGPPSADITFDAGTTPPVADVSVTNSGYGIGVFRITSSASWLSVRNVAEPWPGIPAGRSLDASVAIGADVQVKVATAPAQFRAGWPSHLKVVVDPARFPGGTQTATLTIAPVNAGGFAYTLSVTATEIGVPGPTPTPPNYSHNSYVPNTSSGVQN